VNLERHISNVREVYGLPAIVSINRFTTDTSAEIQLLTDRVKALGAEVVLADHWAQGGAGAAELAERVVAACETPSAMTFVYEDQLPLFAKIEAIAQKVYGASEVTADKKIRTQIKELETAGYGHFPVCVAKTQYSFSTDPALRGAPIDHSINIREVRLAAGAEFIVMVCGDVMTMPGLPKVPSSEKINVVNNAVVGLF
jgi:formate--tetrahydrofolate ligase